MKQTHADVHVLLIESCLGGSHFGRSPTKSPLISVQDHKRLLRSRDDAETWKSGLDVVSRTGYGPPDRRPQPGIALVINITTRRRIIERFGRSARRAQVRLRTFKGATQFPRTRTCPGMAAEITTTPSARREQRRAQSLNTEPADGQLPELHWATDQEPSAQFVLIHSQCPTTTDEEPPDQAV